MRAAGMTFLMMISWEKDKNSLLERSDLVYIARQNRCGYADQIIGRTGGGNYVALLAFRKRTSRPRAGSLEAT